MKAPAPDRLPQAYLHQRPVPSVFFCGVERSVLPYSPLRLLAAISDNSARVI